MELGVLFLVFAAQPGVLHRNPLIKIRITITIKRGSSHFGPLGTDLGRLGTAVGTDKTCRILNVYRPWDGGTDKMGGEGMSNAEC